MTNCQIEPDALNALRDLARRPAPVLCRLGIHRWSAWDSLKPAGFVGALFSIGVQCRICLSCGLVGEHKATFGFPTSTEDEYVT